MTRRLLPLLAAALLALPLSPAGAAKRNPHHNPSGDPSAVANAGSIHGTVRAGTKSLCHIAVHLVHKNRTAHTNKSGQFSFNNLKPGVYTLVAHTRHHGSARATLAIDKGQSTDLVLAVRPPRFHHFRYGGVATPGHTPGHTVGL